MHKDMDILTFADINVDLIINGSNMRPEFGQKEKIADNYILEMGGSACIFASQTARLGLRTAVIGKAGFDSFGDLVVDTLEKAGVNTSYISRDSQVKTGLSVILNTGHDRAIITYTGTIDCIGKNDISEEQLKRTRHLHIASYFLMKKLQPHYAGILKKLKEYGATISLDTNWDPEETWNSGLVDILPFVDIFFPNENEIKAIAGEATLKKSIKKIKDMIPVLVVKKGIDGAEVYSADGYSFAPSIPGPKADAVGAGDSFDGGFIYGYLNGKSPEECLRIGCICGSLNTRMAGGIKGQPYADELAEYL